MTKNEVIDIVHKTILGFFDVVADDSEEPISEKDKLLLEINKTVCNAIKDMPDDERKTMTHEVAVGFLQASGWLQDHDRQIYEQGEGVRQMPISCKCILDHLLYKSAITVDQYDKILRNLKGIEWHPYPKETPAKDGFYLATLELISDARVVRVVEFKNKTFFTPSRWSIVVAWAELPKPYEEGAEK